MFVLPHQSRFGWAVAMTLLHAVALISTILRISIRLKTVHLWWDDYLVLIPQAVDIYFLAALYFSPLSLREINPANFPPQGNLYSYWYSIFPTLTVVWLARIGLSLSLVRTFSKSHPRRWVVVGVGIFFVVAYLGSVLAMAFGCSRPVFIPGGPKIPPMCLHPTGVSGVVGPPIAFSADLVADVLLFVVPLYFLWGIKLPSKGRRVILAAFSTSILTLSSIIIYMIFRYGNFVIDSNTLTVVSMLGHIEASIGLIACNLLVISTFLYRIISKGSDDNDSSEHSRHGWQHSRRDGSSGEPTRTYQIAADLYSGRTDVKTPIGNQLQECYAIISLNRMPAGSTEDFWGGKSDGKDQSPQ